MSYEVFDTTRVIWGISMNTSTSNCEPIKRFCRHTGEMCELAGDFGYCTITACAKKNHGARKDGDADE